MWPSGNFSDISFPPNNSSLSWTKDYSTVTWYSPSDVEAVPSLWGKTGVTEAAVRQGGLGDCWLLASIAALAEWPDRVKKIFGGIESWPSNRKFDLNLWIYGTPTRVSIDDKLPATINAAKTAINPKFT